MNIKFFKIYNNDNPQSGTETNKTTQYRTNFAYPNLKPLKSDTISFSGKSKGNTQKVKKSDFSGIDYAVVEKFRVNISSFKNTADLQLWAKNKVKKDFLEKEFVGKQKETTIARKVLLFEWFDYLTNSENDFSDTEQLLIMDAITKDLKTNNDSLPPKLDKEILHNTLSSLKDQLKIEPKCTFNLNKSYLLRQKALCLKETTTGETESKWIVIPSYIHDPENFEKNYEKLKILSHDNWCTKSFKVENYLKKGDFHIYLDKGNPKVIIRCIGDEISEIQGEMNNFVIPQEYFDEIKKHILEGNMKIKSTKANKEISEAIKAQDLAKKIQRKTKSQKTKQETENYIKILSKVGIKAEENNDGMLTLSHYAQPNGFNFKDINFDEKKLFEKVVRIKGDADFEGSGLDSTGSLQKIDGNAEFWGSNITCLPNLKYIGKDAIFQNSQITNLNELEYIGGFADFSDSAVEDFGKLRTIESSADFRFCKAYSLGNIETIGKNANFEDSQIENLGKLKSVGKDIYLTNSMLSEKDLNNIDIKGEIIK